MKVRRGQLYVARWHIGGPNEFFIYVLVTKVTSSYVYGTEVCICLDDHQHINPLPPSKTRIQINRFIEEGDHRFELVVDTKLIALIKLLVL